MRTLQRLALMAAFGASFLTPHGAGQSTFTTIYRFKGPPDGVEPYGVTGANGVLYGTTRNGGTYGAGTVFALQGPLGSGTAAETVLYSFTGGGDGNDPIASPVMGANGALYGTTAGGGASDCGTVFELLPPAEPGGAWTETVLYNFKGGDDQDPNSSLVFGPQGELFGVAFGDGEDNYGEVFELQPPAQPGGAWTETVPYSFNTNPLEIGEYSDGGVAIGPGGVLYGATHAGVEGYGTVYELRPPAAGSTDWTASAIYAFTDADGGGSGATPTVGPGGTLYGTTTLGGSGGWGTVFQLTPPSAPGGTWTKIVLYNFSNTGDGGNPSAPLVLNKGSLYGTTIGGMAAVVFELRKPAAPGDPWTEIVLHTFPSIYKADSWPSGNIVVEKGGTLYGTTSYGPGRQGSGTVFRIKP